MEKLGSREKVAYAIGEHYGDLLRAKSHAEHQMDYVPRLERGYWKGRRDAFEKALFSLRDTALVAEVPSWD
jgi:hypothetical protein